MNDALQIRDASATDAEAISQLIVRALQQSNAQDYPPAVIARVVGNFSPAAVARLIATRQVLVAELDTRIIGTAGLDGEVVRSVFVEPTMQGRGVGRALMLAVARAAALAGVTRLSVPASLTAQAFYTALGYGVVREVVDNDERTLVMVREL